MNGWKAKTISFKESRYIQNLVKTSMAGKPKPKKNWTEKKTKNEHDRT